MEAGDPSISLDLCARALDAMSVSVHATVDSAQDPIADPLLEDADLSGHSEAADPSCPAPARGAASKRSDVSGWGRARA